MTYVLSDIHGNERRFRSVMKQIRLQPEDTLYVLGDVIDRHPGGIRILRQLMKMPNVKMLLGNHEYMMLQALGHPYDSREATTDYERSYSLGLWYHNGGRVTHDHLKRIRKELREEIFSYLQKLPLNMDLTVGDRRYKLIHGAPVDWYSPNPRYDTAAMYAVWKRIRETDLIEGDYTLIFGHTPTRHYQSSDPLCLWYGRGCIGIDCGSGFPDVATDGKQGRLACLRLEDGAVFYSE